MQMLDTLCFHYLYFVKVSPLLGSPTQNKRLNFSFEMYWLRSDTAPLRPNVLCMTAEHSTEC